MRKCWHACLALANLPQYGSPHEQEVIRDLTRAREDIKAIELKARQRLGAFLLRHGKIYGGKGKWGLLIFVG